MTVRRALWASVLVAAVLAVHPAGAHARWGAAARSKIGRNVLPVTFGTVGGATGFGLGAVKGLGTWKDGPALGAAFLGAAAVPAAYIIRTLSQGGDLGFYEVALGAPLLGVGLGISVYAAGNMVREGAHGLRYGAKLGAKVGRKASDGLVALARRLKRHRQD
jgi:hypothetical protein